MKRIFTIFISAAAILSGCNQQLIEVSEEGQLSLELSASGDYVVATKASAQDNINEFTIDIKGPSNIKYNRFGDMPQVLTLPSGLYTITASSPSVLPAAFDQPIYGTTHQFSVNVGKVTTEKLVCTLQNVKVTFALSQAFANELSSYTISVSNGSAVQNTLYWTNVPSEVEDQYTTKNINMAGYFSVAPLTIRVDGKRATDGSEAYHEIKLLDVAAKDHFIVTLDAKVTGTAGFQITVDPSVNERPEDVFVPGFKEDPVPEEEEDDNTGGNTPGDDNTGTGDDNTGEGDDNTGNEGGDQTNPIVLDWPLNPTLAKTTIADEMNVLMYVNVPAGIEDFVVTIKSQSQTFLSTCSLMTSNPQEEGNIESVVLDLIDDPLAVASMGGIGLQTGDQLYGKTNVEFNISVLVPLIPTQGPVYGSDYIFNLKVTDKNGISNDWDLVFYLPAE